MARVTHRAVSARPAKIRAHRNRPYKVIQETVTQDKKKQLNLVTFSKSPPTGFLFIPTGNPNLTQRCKILSRLETSKIFTVSGSLGSRKNSISRESHRIGYHFTRSVVTKACAELGLDINEVQEASHQRNGPLQRILEGDTSGARLIGKTARVELPQEVLNARARDAIKDLFPLIPDRDMQEIVACAFRKGSNKVGTADSLPLARRVQLAVVAHIRHVYTEYDNLLRTGPWIEARKKVEEACVYRLVRWRGDEDTGGNDDLEQIVREVVVISDDESDIDGNVDDLEAEDRDSSVEIISSEEFALQDKSRLQQRAQSLAATNQSQGTFPDSRSLLSMELRHRRSPQLQQKVPVKFDRRGFTRYRAWDQALERYKHDPKTPILVMRDPVRYREEQSHGDRLVMHSLDRPHGISLAAESTHRLPQPSSKLAAPSFGSIQEGRYRDSRDQQQSSQYKNLQGSLQYHTRDSHYYKPPRANKVARELRGMSPHETSYDELNHQDVPWNRPTQEPLRGTLVADLDKNRPRCYEAVLPSIEKSAPRPNPMNVHYNPPLNQQDIRNDGKDRLPGRVGQLLPSNFQRREHSAVHIIDDNHDEHALASKRRKVEHFPLRPRDAESDPTLESNVNHMRIMRPMTPQRAHEISGTLRSPLHSGVSNIRLATPQSDRFKPVGRSTELPYMSNAYSATSTRSGVPIFPFTDTPEPLSSSRKSLHHPTHNNFPASQCAMNYVHSSLPTPPFSKELYPLRHDTQQSQHSTQIRARPAPPLWNTDRYEGRQSPDQINLEEARSIEQERLSRHVFGEPTSMVSTRPVATENRLSDGHVSGHPRSSLGSKDLSLYEKKVPPGQSTIGDGQSQGVSVSKHVHGSRFYEELPRHDGSGIVRHDPRLPTQSEGEPVYIPHQQPITSTRYETVPDHRFHRRPAPRESHLPYHENTLNDHDVIVIKEQKDAQAMDQPLTNHPRYGSPLPRYIYEQRPRYRPQFVPIDHRDPQLLRRSVPPREIIVLE